MNREAGDRCRSPDSEERQSGGEDGDRLENVVGHLQSVREDDQRRREQADSGVVLDQLDKVKARLCHFSRALGGGIDEVSELPFTEESGTDGMPGPLYVRHDQTMLNQVTSWLLKEQHIGLISPYGTGKTAFREIVRRDLGDHDGFLVSHITNPQQTTPGALYEEILTVAGDTGVKLSLSGTPAGRERLASVRATLDSRIRYYEGIDPFDPENVAESVARSLAYVREEPDEERSQDLFTSRAIADIHERTGGNPRGVRLECRELFTRAASVWYRTNREIDRIRITPEMRNRRYGIG